MRAIEKTALVAGLKAGQTTSISFTMSVQLEASAGPIVHLATLGTAILAIYAQDVTLHAQLVEMMTSSTALTAILPSHAM